MLRDVFYYGKKPNAHPREKFASSLEDAKNQSTTEHFWIINEFCDYTGFDWDWDFDFLPDEDVWAENYINVWPSISNKDSGTWLCSVNYKDAKVYRADVQLLNKKPDVEYQKYYIETTLEDLIKDHPNEVFWALNHSVDYTNFDFNWEPNPSQTQYVQVFGSPANADSHTYLVNSSQWVQGMRDFHYVTVITLDNNKIVRALVETPDIFFIDRGNVEARTRFEKLQNKFGARIQRTRYLNSWVDTIIRCVNRSSTSLCWIINSELDYSKFDFEYKADMWNIQMTHVIGSQWSQWGTTYLIYKDTFIEATKYVNQMELLPNLHFVQECVVETTDILYDIVYIDHGNVPTNTKQLAKIIIQYDTDYRTTFSNLLDQLPNKKEHYVWVISSICDYTKFNFSYTCDPHTKDHLHVFPSDTQKFGDTFLVNVNKLRELLPNLNCLSEYDSVNFNKSQTASRIAPPLIITDDTHVANVKYDFDFPYAIFKTKDSQNLSIEYEPISLWKESDKTITILSTGATNIIVPKEAKNFVKNELYDYPYIIKSNKLAKSKNMDVVFMSNGETGEDNRHNKLAKILGHEPKWIKGVKGRENAIRKCAEISDTDWVLVVPGKLEINKKFDFSWQPDRMQEPKHYIFYATNPLNKLCYGHMAPVMYNKRLVLETIEYGLDFTMSKKHEIVPVNAGIAHYNLDPLMTWRTAFREALKLKHAGDSESESRLIVWLTEANGINANYSIDGANDAIDYYNEVNGDPDKLQLSFAWDWLQERFDLIYNK